MRRKLPLLLGVSFESNANFKATKILPSGGRIPDAALIHAARKRRQQVREMGTANYIPIDEENSVKVE